MRSKNCFPVLCLLAFCAAIILLSRPVFGAEEQDPQMAEYEALAKQYDSLRGDAGKQMSPQELAAACDELIDDFNELIQSASSNPSVKSKSQMLLSYVYGFRGMEPESRQAYSDYLDTLESWQGTDYAVMVVRRAGGRMLNKEADPTQALVYYELLLEKYPNHESRADALYHAGLACLYLDCYAEAAEKFGAAFQADPQGYWAPWCLRKKAFALELNATAGTGHADALAVLDELEERFPNPHWGGYACYRRGYILQIDGKDLEAVAEYQKGMEQYPTSPYSKWSRRRAQKVQEQLEQQMLDEMAREGRKDELHHAEVSDGEPRT